jgi:hypothetical protein
MMAGYIIWISENWTCWRAENGRHRDASLSDEDHAAFDAWLGR